MLHCHWFYLILQVNNACATGSTALILGKQLIEGGIADCILALGFEKMERGSLKSHVGALVWKMFSVALQTSSMLSFGFVRPIS